MKKTRIILQILLLFSCVRLLEAQKICINEVHCEAAKGDGRVEFVEIHNFGPTEIDLSNWRLTKGIKYVFPQGTRLAAGQFAVIVADKAAFTKRFGGLNNVFGHYEGRLSAESEKITLLGADGVEVDKFEYALGFPYPTVDKSKGTSLQLLNPQLKAKHAGHWRTALPTPCAANHASILLLEPNAPPLIEAVQHLPLSPKSSDEVYILAEIKDKQGVAQVDVLYQLVPAGGYIRLRDAAYELPRNWVALAMSDDGKNGDFKANDGIFTAKMPAVAQKHRQLVRYRIVAKDSTGLSLRVPYADDPQPNFAYFVFDAPAPYLGKYDFAKVQKMPICQLLAKPEDVQYNINSYRGDDYKNSGTVVYNGQVYDHVGFRSRGYNNRHARQKRNLKFNFARGHDIETLDNYGKPYPEKRGKWLLSGTWLLDKPNTHGLAEGVLYRLFNLQGAPATTADYVHLRVITNSNENDSTAGDFWGLYLVMENFDKDFLKNHKLPAGNIYAYKPPTLRYQIPDTLAGMSNAPYLDWDKNCEKTNTEDWWRTHLDLKAYFGFLATQEAINNRETGYRKQHWWMEYHNPKADNWTIFPWDMDATWTTTKGNTTISGAIRKAAFAHPEIEKEYQNHLREFLDLLYNTEQTGKIIDEYASFIYDSNAPYSLVQLDKLRWGHKYSHSFGEEIRRLKEFVAVRAEVMRAKLPTTCPSTATILPITNPPADKLVFTCSDYKDAQAFAAMQWRLADMSEATANEINAVWQSGELISFSNTINLPYGAAIPNHKYRLRVRFKNQLGYYGHWSPPLEFVAAAPVVNPQHKIIFTEVLAQTNKTNPVEFVELKNVSADTINLRGYALAGAVKYKFDEDILLLPNAYLVFSSDSSKFAQTYQNTAFEYRQKLNKKGETLIFRDPAKIVVDSLQYPEIAAGFSLQRSTERGDAYDWQISPTAGGNPYQAAVIPKIEVVEIKPDTPIKPAEATPLQKMQENFQIFLILLRLALFQL